MAMVSVAEFAKLLGVHHSSVDAACVAGKLPGAIRDSRHHWRIPKKLAGSCTVVKVGRLKRVEWPTEIPDIEDEPTDRCRLCGILFGEGVGCESSDDPTICKDCKDRELE